MTTKDLPGIAALREKRGDEQVTFDNVADHLFDYAERHPDQAGAVDALARFLAGVEDIDHDHSSEPGPRPRLMLDRAPRP